MPLRRRGHLRQLRVAVIVSFLDPVPPALLNEPESHDVSQESDRPADTAFVRVVVAQRFLVDHRLIESTPIKDHVPELM